MKQIYVSKPIFWSKDTVGRNEWIYSKKERNIFGNDKKRAIITHACQMERPHKQMVERENRVQLSFWEFEFVGKT